MYTLSSSWGDKPANHTHMTLRGRAGGRERKGGKRAREREGEREREREGEGIARTHA